jgi:transposase-like protein
MILSEQQENALSHLTGSEYYPLEVKKAAITDYLTTSQSLESISKQYSIRGASTLAKWLIKLGLHQVESRTSMRYTTAFKMEVAYLAQMGQESMESLGRKYSIKGSSTIARWCKKYPVKTYLPVSKKKVLKQQDKDVAQLEQTIRELKAQVASQGLKIEVLEEILEIGKREYKLDLKKKYNTKRSPT